MYTDPSSTAHAQLWVCGFTAHAALVSPIAMSCAPFCCLPPLNYPLKDIFIVSSRGLVLSYVLPDYLFLRVFIELI